MFQSISTVSLVLVAVALYQTATLVIGGYVAKDLLAGFYHQFPQWWQRMLIVIIPLSGLGNLLAVYAFQNPIVAGVTFLVAGLWSPLIAASIIHQTSYSFLDMAIVATITALGVLLGIRLS